MDIKKIFGQEKIIHEEDKMKDILLSTLTGFGCGVVFAAFKLPVPAPPVFAGVAGIVGLWAGYAILIKVLS
jgi:XapX domain-containing protein